MKHTLKKYIFIEVFFFSESFVSIKVAIGKMVVGGVNLKYRIIMCSDKVMSR
jgi:hypothetical protein